ncbi:hypothetical protein P879_11977, partial [Paragonimus westermani]
MAFSTVVRLKEVDDYIAPSKSCIKPVKIDTQRGKTKAVRIESDGTYTALTEDGNSYTLKKAKISLNDCLACSGCITTAESVLISEHSVDTFMQFLDENRNQLTGRRILAISLSPQSLTSLGEKIMHDSGNLLLSQRFRRWIAEDHLSIDFNQLDLVRSFVAGILH